MKGRWAKYVATGAMLAMLAACSSKPTDRGQQYSDGKFTQPFSLVNQPDAVRGADQRRRLLRAG